MKKILIIADSFKGSASSIEVANLIKKGIQKVRDDLETKIIPIADGGEGTVESIITALGGEINHVNVHDPLGNIIKSYYGISNGVAIIEMASASGLPLVGDNKNPLIASTYGTGEIILDAIKSGIKNIFIGIGGSATNDFGIGMASALGYRFLDKLGKEIEPLAKNMIDITDIDCSNVCKEIFDISITVACDVQNPLYGENGATAIYGKQKGVTDETFDLLDSGLKNISNIVNAKMNKKVADIKGSGAAGGLGGGLIAFCDASLKSGIDAILDMVGFEKEIASTSLIITGEGAIDGQTKEGKVPVGIAKRAKNVPVIAIVGDIREGAEVVYDMGILSIMPALKKAMPLEEAIRNSHALIEDAAERAMRFISINL